MKASIAALDSEDDGQGNPLLFVLVDEKSQTWSRERHVMLEKIAQRAADRGELEIWCTNLEYDLLNLFGVERIAELQLIFGKSYLIAAKWRGHKVRFKDTVRHLPIGVEALGELLGLKKREARLFDGGQVTFEKLKRRCIRDTAITRRAALKLHELYGELGAEPKLTLASSAYHVWAAKYWKREVRRPLYEHWLAAFEAYFGGRTEPFAIGEFEGVQACDASSMFPWAMTTRPMPLPWGRFRRVGAGSESIDPEGFYRVSVRADGGPVTTLPVLPYRSQDGLVFPTGRWQGWYAGCELLRHVELGGQVRVLEGFEFLERVRPFDGYIKAMFERKKRSTGARRLFYKLMLNALYGKFGQRGERVIAMPLGRFSRLKSQPANFRVWAGMAMFSVKGTPPPWGNMVWSAITTARSRVRLHQELTQLIENGARPLYCDTDGVLYLGGKTHPIKAAAPGEFEFRGTYRCAIIKAKKEYALQDSKGLWSFYAKGVPLTERETYLKTGEAEFRRPVKLRESARSGDAPNVWRAVRKTRHVTFDHRGRRADGSLAPVQVDERSNQRSRSENNGQRAARRKHQALG